MIIISNSQIIILIKFCFYNFFLMKQNEYRVIKYKN